MTVFFITWQGGHHSVLTMTTIGLPVLHGSALGFGIAVRVVGPQADCTGRGMSGCSLALSLLRSSGE